MPPKKKVRRPPGPRPMDTDIVIMNVRVPGKLRDALAAYARDETRPASTQLRLILQEALREKGYLK
jgi:hypothetical protein